MTSHLETLLRVGVLNHVFTDSFSLRTSFANSPSRLRWRLRALAIVDLALMPVLLLYHVAHFVFQHADVRAHTACLISMLGLPVFDVTCAPLNRRSREGAWTFCAAGGPTTRCGASASTTSSPTTSGAGAGLLLPPCGRGMA